MAPELLSPETLVVFATLLAAVSGVPLLVPSFVTAAGGQLIAVTLMLASTAVGLTGSVLLLLTQHSTLYQLSWTLSFGTTQIGVDPLSAWFLLPIFLVPGCSALYAREYWHGEQHASTVRTMTFFFGMMTASMAGVVLARDGISFLFSWEIMALAAYFLITTEDEKQDVNQAGTLYMITTHTGTLGLFALFPLLFAVTGSWMFPPAGSLSASSPLSTALFLTALFAFGLKAGIMPFHIWLPSAHASAPSHISATMSGVILKVGIYGLVRTLSFFNTVPLWWGCVVLALAIVSGILGVLFAIGQHDLKRLLAYHSIENIGIIFIGLGVALIGSATASPAMMLLGMGGALLHVLNHATFKALLFLGAGSVIHASGTREIDLLGGTARRLPRTALLFGVGAVAICGLPPLNGFVSELLIYLGMFRGGQGSGVAAAATVLAAPALTLIGGLAVACFVKVYGIVFLGAPRSERYHADHEAGWQMLVPMTVLALICFVIGCAPALIAKSLQNACLATLPLTVPPADRMLADLVPLTSLTFISGILVILMAVIAVCYRRQLSVAPVDKTITWSCGYQRPTTRMQYSASSFAQLLTRLFAFILKPQQHNPAIPAGIFPPPTRFESHFPETVLELVYIPALENLYQRSLPIRKLQSGILQQYVLYTLITLIALLLSN